MYRPSVIGSHPAGATGCYAAYGYAGATAIDVYRHSFKADGTLGDVTFAYHYPLSALYTDYWVPRELRRCRGCGRWNAPWPWTDEPWEKTHPFAEYCSQRCQWRTRRARFPRQRPSQLAGYQIVP